jgi:MFS transporter, DHA2 family, multidrug resistance protein
VRDYAHQLNIVTLSRRVALAQTVNAQAEAVAFIDSFKLMMIVSFLAIPLVILVQRLSRQLGNQGRGVTTVVQQGFLCVRGDFDVN